VGWGCKGLRQIFGHSSPAFLDHTLENRLAFWSDLT
jgi:hypothetical protein